MPQISEDSMRDFLRRSIASTNRNKVNGLLAEVDFRSHLASCGFGARVSPGGWIARRDGPGQFGHHTAVFFPEFLHPGTEYGADRQLPPPHNGLHTICATFHQSGISAYYCVAVASGDNDPSLVSWKAIQLGVPTQEAYQDFPLCVSHMFRPRERRYPWLRNNADVAGVPSLAIAEEFSKEHLRVCFQERFMAEVVDVDGIFWGQQFTYPMEVKEKTPANDNKLGDYFGLDVGPFVKLAYYAAKRGNLKSIFVVREIDSVETRRLVAWWYITFDHLAQFASWNPVAGGTNMRGGGSTVIKIPKAEFQRLDSTALARL